MRRFLLVSVTMFLVGGLGSAADALPQQPICPVDAICGNPPPPPPPPPPTCPNAIPVPANAFDCQCKTTGRSGTRCGGALPPDQCTSLINQAYSEGLLTTDGRDWLSANGYCPVLFNNAILDFCPVGCFEASSRLLEATPRGQGAWTAADGIKTSANLFTLADNADTHAVRMSAQSLNHVVFGPEDPALFVFHLSNGARLRVTTHHAMLLGDGTVVEAQHVQAGARFVGVNGKPVMVNAVTREKTSKDVYNFWTNGSSDLGHVIAAEGVLVGDLKLQNELMQEQHSIELRR